MKHPTRRMNHLHSLGSFAFQLIPKFHSLSYEEKFKKRMVLGQDGNQLVNLIAIVSIAFVLLQFVSVIYQLTGLTKVDFKINVYDHFVLPSSLANFLKRPWTIITYMFVHNDLMRVLANVLWLWAFGFILQDLMGNRKIIPLFLYGGLAAGIFFLITYNVFLRDRFKIESLEGSSAGVLCIAIATTFLSPRYRIFPMLNGGVPLWILTAVFIIIDFASIPITDSAAQASHLAGGLTGILFVFLLKRNIDLTRGPNYVFDRIGNLFNPSNKSVAKAKQKHFYKVGATHPFRKVPNITQQRIDALLDKIHQKGYRSLNEEEKEILRRASEGDNL